MISLLKNYARHKDDTEEQSFLKLLILGVAISCSVCGIFWSFLYYLVFGVGITMMLPLVFVLIVGAAIIISGLKRNHFILVHTQIICIVGITTLLQLSIGSADASGMVMCWAFLGPIGALMFLSKRHAAAWLLIFIGLLAFALFIGSDLVGEPKVVSGNIRAMFYLMNIGTPAIVIFFAARYFVGAQIEQKLKNRELRNIAEQKNKEILDSITYAKRIQSAILPPMSAIKNKFPNSFVLYKPKDIVAGDFYWMEEIEGTVLIAASDCTGHGVPGAMVSVVCSNALNRAVNEFKLSEPGKVLDKVTDLVLESLAKSNSDVKDGMDISVLAINKNAKTIQWSGANNPLWYFAHGKLEIVAPDKQPVGQSDHRKPFTTHHLEYVPESTFYLFTDGYADQFGGPKGKKFKSQQLRAAIAAIALNDAAAQYAMLDKTFEEWKGNLEQVDDVCVIGIGL